MPPTFVFRPIRLTCRLPALSVLADIWYFPVAKLCLDLQVKDWCFKLPPSPAFESTSLCAEPFQRTTTPSPVPVFKNEFNISLNILICFIKVAVSLESSRQRLASGSYSYLACRYETWMQQWVSKNGRTIDLWFKWIHTRMNCMENKMPLHVRNLWSFKKRNLMS